MGNNKKHQKKKTQANKAQHARRSEPPSPITKEPSESVPTTLEMVSNPPVSTEKANEIHEEPVVVAADPVETVVDKVEETTAPLVTPEKLEEESAAAAVVVDEKCPEEPEKPAEEVKDEGPKIVMEEEEPKQEEKEDKEGETEEKVEELKVVEPVEKEEKVVEESEEKVQDEQKKDEEEHKKEELEEESGSQTEEDNGRKRKDSSQTDTTVQAEEPEVFTDYTWEKTDEEVNIKQAIFVKSYNYKFAVFLRVIDPEFRFVAGIGPSSKLDPEENVKVFDPEGVSAIFERMKKEGFSNPCPFQNENFKASFEEIRLFLSEVLTKIKFCLRLACAERGYEYKSGKFTNQPISAVWGVELDPMLELKTIKAIMDEVKEPITKMLTEEGQETRFWTEFKTIYEEVLPALEAYDSKTLADNNISDCMATIHGRQELGFEITEEEVDRMLEQSFTEDGFGEFPSTALYAPTLFTSSKQLKLIYVQLEKMSKVTDIRVKLAGIQTITRIIHSIDQDESIRLMEEFEDHPKLPVEKMFGLNPLEFSVNTNEPKRAQYLKIFYTALGETNPKEDTEMTLEQLQSVFKCFYMVFPAFEINMILFKILGTHIKDCAWIDADRKQLVRALFSLPEPLRKRLEIGQEYETGEITDDTNSMYYQVKNFIRLAKRDFIGLLVCFLYVGDGSRRLISAERVMRQAMRFIEAGTAQVMAVETLKTLLRPSMSDLSFSKEFFEDLIVLALSKYSVPDAKCIEKKYAFMTIVFDIVNSYKENHVLEIDSKKIAEKWTDMAHPWFSVLFLAHKFPILKDSIPAGSYPWLSADVWTDDENHQNHLKNYIPLAKVPTAWPKCTNLSSVVALVNDHVPIKISRKDLYAHMIDYVRAGDVFTEPQKTGLLNELMGKVVSLTASETAKKPKEPSSDKKSKDKRKKSPAEKLEIKKTPEVASEKAAEKLVKEAKETQTSPMPQVEKPEKPEKPETPVEAVEEEPEVIDLVEEEDSEDVKEEKEKEEKEDEAQKWEFVQMAEVKKEVEDPEEDQNPEKLDTPEPGKEATVETVVSQEVPVKVEPETTPDTDTLKPLKELDADVFYGWYEPEEWEPLPEIIVNEIYRQRAAKGYSNKL
ncbi:hypothetical protein CAEBREN_25995 [Caenorhabditis brenneri]|uniref:Uncharacterized protein n=1 Tax=Caenorhabditis brenneri TaxID=135651 RepID=G0MFF1_CAEBE|nr:hypothetical protein CAEBREN_25995 [Caenorhabditis brenneri]